MLRAAFGLVLSTLCLGLVACGSDDTGDGTTADTSTSGAGAAGSGGSGSGATGSGGMTASSASTGAGGEATGGAGGEAAAPTVEMTLNPTTIPAGGSTEATVTVTNFVLQPPGGANEDGHGHYHIYLDGATSGNYLVANQVPTVTVKIPATTQPGPHTLRVSVSDNNHAPLVPDVEDIVDITVE